MMIKNKITKCKTNLYLLKNNDVNNTIIFILFFNFNKTTLKFEIYK